MKQKSWLALAVTIIIVAAGVELYVWRSGPSEKLPEDAPSFNPMTYFPHLQPGEIAEDFEGEYVAGGVESISYPEDGGMTLLFVLSPSCGTCAKTIPVWNQLAAQIEPPARVFGFVMGSYQGEKRLLEEKPLDVPLLRFPSPNVVQQYKITRVPQTILVGPGGKVETAILGELDSSQVRGLLERLGVGPEEPSV